MRQECYWAPRSEMWVIEKLANAISIRLGDSGLSDPQRRSLLRFLFGLQRFPRKTPGLNLHIEWAQLETACLIRLTPEFLSIQREHAYLQYWEGSNHFMDFYSQPVGLERQEAIENWLPLFFDIQDPDTRLIVEDYSSGDSVDRPPLNEQWSHPIQAIYFDDPP